MAILLLLCRLIILVADLNQFFFVKKHLILLLLLTTIAGSCSKKADPAPDLATLVVGEWAIYELTTGSDYTIVTPGDTYWRNALQFSRVDENTVSVRVQYIYKGKYYDYHEEADLAEGRDVLGEPILTLTGKRGVAGKIS